jgi:hypothetical protein
MPWVVDLGISAFVASDFAPADLTASALGAVFVLGPWLWAKPEKAEKNNRRQIDPARKELLNMHFIKIFDLTNS